MNKPSILILAEHLGSIEHYQNLLGPSFQVEALSTLSEVENVVQHLQPHVVVFDLDSKPNVVRELAQALRDKRTPQNEMTLVQIVSHSLAQSCEVNIEAGIDHFCSKTVVEDQFKATILAALRTRSIRMELQGANQKLNRINERLKKLSLTDELTGLYNMRHMAKQLRNEFKRAERYRKPLTLVMLDIDNFKHVNNSFNHMLGSYIMTQVGHEIGDSIRFDIDYAARSGGDEFLIVLPETDLIGALVFADRLHKKLGDTTYDNGMHHTRISISMGLGFYDGVNRSLPNVEELIKVAEASLKHAKDQGGGSVHAIQSDRHKKQQAS
jgi:two-component system, cell cycle response regulator